MKKGRILLLLLAAAALIVCCIVAVHSFISKPSSPQKLIDSLWEKGDIHIIAMTELTDHWDLVFYSSSVDGLSKVVLERDDNGRYTGNVIGSGSGNLDENQFYGTLLTKEPECTLYFGIPQAPDWHMDYNGTVHRIMVDDYIFDYFLYPKTMDEELLHVEFVQTIE